MSLADTEMKTVSENTIQHTEDDVAQNEFKEKIAVGVPGRRRFQKIWVRAPNNKRSRRQYNPEDDAPWDQAMSMLPTAEETEKQQETLEFLVVGLVLADTPTAYSNKGSGVGGKNTAREQALQARGTLAAQKNILRAIVPVTENMTAGSIKYYVACRPEKGLYGMRLITSDTIFFFDEFWNGIPTDANIKTRRTSLGKACRFHAAENKESPVKPLLTPKPSNNGAKSFFDFKNALQKDDVEKFIREVTIKVPDMCPLNAELIVDIHNAMRVNDLGTYLAHQDLALFLRLAHRMAQNGWCEESIVEIVHTVLDVVDDVNKIQPVSPWV